MLVVRIDLGPGGSPQLIENIGVMTIVNTTGAGDAAKADYEVNVQGIGGGVVHGHLRRQGAWPLVAKALKSVGVK